MPETHHQGPRDHEPQDHERQDPEPQDHQPQDHQPQDHRTLGPLADASVREARATDAPAVGQVQAQVFIDTYADKLLPEVAAAFDPQAFARGWRDALTDPPPGAHRLLVALAGAQVVGAAAYGPSQDPDTGQATGELTLLAVHPLARRQGHGSRLLNACVDQLRDLGADTVTAWLLADAEETRAFLLGAGLEPDGAYRDRVVSPDGATLREVRVRATLGQDTDDDAQGGDG